LEELKMKNLFTAALFFIFISLPGLTVHAATISVSQFVEHPALDAVLRGFQDYLKEKEIEVEYTVHNAQANMGTATQIAQQMVGEKADLLVAIATPSAQTCVQALNKAPADLKRPFLFTAVTDPVAAGLVKDLQRPDPGITGVSDLLPVEEHIKMVLSFTGDIKTLGLLYNAGEVSWDSRRSRPPPQRPPMSIRRQKAWWAEPTRFSFPPIIPSFRRSNRSLKLEYRINCPFLPRMSIR
jgi:putative ABC transport system substrate-binding protein